jgi:hypothetical protein
MNPTHAAGQEGQALPLAMVLLVAVAAIVFFMFNSGQLTQEKLRLTNTADAVAYSAGVFEARILNYDAYTNRAIIANEIAIGQAVGLASWGKYVETTAKNIRPYIRLIPYVGQYLAEMLNRLRTVMDYFTEAVSYTIPIHDAAIQALARSQTLMHGPGDSVALSNRWLVMERVARENDPEARLDQRLLADDFRGFTQRYSSKEERTRMGQVVHDSREAFLRSRNWDFSLVLLCSGIRLARRGSAELIDLTEGWKSMDTLSIHVYRMRRFRCGSSERAIGYGTAFSQDELDDDEYSYAGSRTTNPRASDRADSSEGIANGFDPAPYSIAGGAIPEFQELSESALKQDDPRTHITVRMTKPRQSQRYSGGNSIIQPAGRLDLYQGALVGDESAAIARAEVYFERPDGSNPLHPGREELGSLFNPYWQTRLAPIPASERIAAQRRQGSAQLP